MFLVPRVPEVLGFSLVCASCSKAEVLTANMDCSAELHGLAHYSTIFIILAIFMLRYNPVNNSLA